MMQAKTERPQRGGRDVTMMTMAQTPALNNETDADNTTDEKSEG